MSKSGKKLAKDERDLLQSGTNGGGQKFIISDIKVPSFLKNSRPEAGKKCYIHQITLDPEYDMPEEPRKKVFHALMQTNKCYFGILTLKPLPEICSFPVYSDLGQIRVRLLANNFFCTFTFAELQTIVNFHKFLFMEPIAKVKEWFVFDTESSSGFYVVPLKQKSNGKIVIAWSFMTKTGLKLDRPSYEEEVYSDESYLLNVVTPWYRGKNDIPIFYVITDVNTNIYMDTQMDYREETFAEYFKKKYKLEAKHKEVPLFEARSITNILESIKPRTITASTKLRRRRKRDFPTFFHPEFLIKQNFPAYFWYKSTLLPSIIHRMQYLLLAEELRQTIVRRTGVGNITVPFDRKIEHTFFTEEDSPKKLITDENGNKFSNRNMMKNGRIGAVSFMKPPQLSLFQDHSMSDGPSQYDILQALTLRGANDTICLERLETLGDSFLKFITSFSIFIRHLEMGEGEMTKLRSHMIGNANLTECGKNRDIPGCIQAAIFSVDSGWIAPSFCVPSAVRQCILPEGLKNVGFSSAPAIMPSEVRQKLLQSGKLASLLKVSIPKNEQLSGFVKKSTIKEIKETIKSAKRGNKLEEAEALYCMGKHEISEKNVADTVEAIIGVYLLKTGIEGAFNVAKYFGIIKRENFQELIRSIVPPVVGPDKMDTVNALLPDINSIERLLQYRFEDKGLLLQVFTHTSCQSNKITENYQRLENIGDAVIDLLITDYIYEYSQLPSGEITDYRSALVNNNVLGALAVRLGLHKFLVDPAQSVKEEVGSFVSYQEDKHHMIYGNEFVVVNDRRMLVAEEVKVPKILADVLEALIAAIFIDSRYNLPLVWRIFYNIMENEINQFRKNVPINPVRAVYEMDPEAHFGWIGNVDFEPLYEVTVKVDGVQRNFYGRGHNSTCAKRAAAKLALKNIGYSKFLL